MNEKKSNTTLLICLIISFLLLIIFIFIILPILIDLFSLFFYYKSSDILNFKKNFNSLFLFLSKDNFWVNGLILWFLNIFIFYFIYFQIYFIKIWLNKKNNPKKFLYSLTIITLILCGLITLILLATSNVIFYMQKLDVSPLLMITSLIPVVQCITIFYWIAQLWTHFSDVLILFLNNLLLIFSYIFLIISLFWFKNLLKTKVLLN